MQGLKKWMRGAAGAADRRVRPTVEIYPPLTGEDEFLDVYFKCRFYLPAGTVAGVRLPVDFKAGFDLAAPEAFPRPAHAGNFPEGPRPDIAISTAAGRGLSRVLAEADVVLVWDWSSLERAEPEAAASHKLRNIDRHRNGAEGWTWASLLDDWRSEEERVALQRRCQRTFRRALRRLPAYRKAYVFGTGPSLDQAWDLDCTDGYRIVCNTIVNNRDLLDRIRPHFIVAGDAIYHFGSNRHACAFRADLERALRERELHFIMRDTFYPLFAHHHPGVVDRTLVAGTGRPGVHFDARHWLVYHQWPHGNILNALMLPLASSLADEILLLGFDGRAPGERLFWQNSSANSYGDLRDAIVAAHPAFFRNMDYERYAEDHSRHAETIMRQGEALGKRYVCLNETHIPAFQRRRPADHGAAR